jgi:hypothetical protein
MRKNCQQSAHFLSIMSTFLKSFLSSGIIVTGLFAGSHVRAAVSVAFVDPLGGWDYEYQGAAAAYGSSTSNANVNNPPFDALDGLWSHQNSSDEWGNAGVHAADAPGTGNGDIGGVGLITDGAVTGLRIVDGKNAGATADNRKIAFTKDLTVVPNHGLITTGLTLTFRGRLIPDAAVEGTLSTTNKGGVIGSGGKGFYGVRLDDGTNAFISFSLHQSVEDTNASGGTFAFAGSGLVFNKLNGDTATTANSDTTAAGGTLNDIAIADVNSWHEFWVTIQQNDATAGNGTHTVTVWMDGSLTPVGTYNVTGGNGNENGGIPAGFLFMGHNQTSMVAGYDTDFFAVKHGVIVPIPEPSAAALFGGVGILFLWRRKPANR